MLQVTLIEFILRAIPEAFIYMFAMYTFCGKKVDKSKYIKSSSVLAVGMFLIRFLPISYGIHTILILMMMIGMSVVFNQLNMIGVISAAIINVVIQFISEGINLLFVEKVLGKSLQEIASTPVSKMIYGFPSLVIWALIIALIYKIRGKRLRKKDD